MLESQHTFAKNFAWLVGSEGLVRMTRLVTAIALARYLTIAELGIAALAIASHEFLRFFAANGFGLRVIRCSESELDPLCQSVSVLNWVWSIGLFVLQVCASWGIAHYYGAPELKDMITLLAVIYLTMPLGLTQMYRVHRAQKLKLTAWIDSCQVMADNILTAVLAVAGLGAWAIVLPKLIVAPIWVIGYRLACTWRFSASRPRLPFRSAFSETRSWLSAEFARGLRSQLDVFVIGRVLGAEALGLYYFARNAGLGISLSLLQAATHAMLPRLGQIARTVGTSTTFLRECRQVVNLVLLVTLPIIAAQVLLAPWYVPMVFGDKWTAAVPVLVLLCLSAVPRVIGESVTQIARVAGLANDDARWNTWSAPLFFCAVWLGCHFGIVEAALSVLLFHCLYQLSFVVAIHRKVHRPSDMSSLGADATVA